MNSKKKDFTASNDIHVEKLQLTVKDDVYTVSALVDGEPIWFQSADHTLRMAPEAIAGALLVPAVHLGRNLVFADPLCPVWLDHARQLMDFYHQWWDWPPVEISSSTKDTPVKYEGDKTGLCFSGGVDSFYSIITYPEPIDMIITVHGYDIALDDEAGAAHAITNTHKVANEYGIKALSIKTNLRQHHIAGKRFRNSHEGALAAIGYLVEGMGTLIISSDYSREALHTIKHGLHWKTTPLRSSKDIRIRHYGEQYSRAQKIDKIAGNPVLCKHLRVCQQNLKPGFDLSGQFLNCGTCAKCVLTLIVLQHSTELDTFECFANTKHLAHYLDQVVTIDEHTCSSYEKHCTVDVEPALQHAFRALVWRSRFLNKRPWLGRKGTKFLGNFFKSWHNFKQRLSQ